MNELQRYKIQEKTALAYELVPGMRVIIAIDVPGSGKTTYHYGQVFSVSSDKKVVTVGEKRSGDDVVSVRFDGSDGYLFTSRSQEKYHKRLLLETDSLVSYMHRQELLQQFRAIVPEIESTMTLETMLHAYNAGKALTIDAENEFF